VSEREREIERADIRPYHRRALLKPCYHRRALKALLRLAQDRGEPIAIEAITAIKAIQATKAPLKALLRLAMPLLRSS
jgi:methylglyoxal synthase